MDQKLVILLIEALMIPCVSLQSECGGVGPLLMFSQLQATHIVLTKGGLPSIRTQAPI
jgi:hypothetical protein